MTRPAKRLKIDWTMDAFDFILEFIKDDNSEKKLEDYVLRFKNANANLLPDENLGQRLHKFICNPGQWDIDLWERAHFAFVFRLEVSKKFKNEITGAGATLKLDEDQKIIKLFAPNFIRHYRPILKNVENREEDQENHQIEYENEEVKPDFVLLSVPDSANPEEILMEDRVFSGFEVLNHVYKLGNLFKFPEFSAFLKDVEQDMEKPEARNKIITMDQITCAVQELLKSVVKNSTTIRFPNLDFIKLRDLLNLVIYQLLNLGFPRGSSITQLLTEGINTYDKELIVPVKKVRLALENLVDELFVVC